MNCKERTLEFCVLQTLGLHSFHTRQCYSPVSVSSYSNRHFVALMGVPCPTYFGFSRMCTTLTVVGEESKLGASHLHFLFVFHCNLNTLSIPNTLELSIFV